MDAAFFAVYNGRQAGRTPRPLLLRARRLAGAGNSRLAIDIGAGAGNETAALLWDGWRVLAVDQDPACAERIRSLGIEITPGALEVWTTDFADVTALPRADLIYAGYSLPFAGQAFDGLWSAMRNSLLPGGWLACQLYGERDGLRELGGDHHFVTRHEALRLLDGLEILEFEEQENDGDSVRGPKHWHVFHVIARRPR
jgi:SAM-dependent methyltransferase